MKKRRDRNILFLSWRFYFVLVFFFIAAIGLISRVVYLTVVNRSFLQTQGNARYLRTIDIPAYRGMIADRNGNPIAVSTPVDSVWVNPQDFPEDSQKINDLAKIVQVSSGSIRHVLRSHKKSQFVYLKRGLSPQLGDQVTQLSIPGVYLEREYRRYYALGEAASQVIGFTNIDDQGQEGLELLFNPWLSGLVGKESALKDRYGHLVAVLDLYRRAKPGHDVHLSLDNRIQFLAYQVLKETVENEQAESGSVVVLNPNNGEILAMANVPSFNPNARPDKDFGQMRNRAVTDMFEPGSTMKAFSIASALDSGKYTPEYQINTTPGWFMIGRNEVKDEHNYGKLNVTQIAQKSSNVGVAKMTISLPPEHFVALLHRLGFDERTQSGFPGESTGSLPYHARWNPFVLATLAFGYGITVTPLQLAHAYGVLASGGLKCPSTFLEIDHPPVCPRVMNVSIAHEMLEILQSVLEKGGTGTLARIPGYSIAGKTGTAYIAEAHGYNHKKYMSSFVGIAPVHDPQLVVAVVIKNPRKAHYGGAVSAPAFARIMYGALSTLNIPPDEHQKT